MKTFFAFCVLSFGMVFSLWKFGGMEHSVMSKWQRHTEAEQVALKLAMENRLLKAEVSDLRYKMNQLESTTKFAAIGSGALKHQNRGVASVPPVKSGDLVSYDVYKWSPEKLLAIGEKELHFKNYEKSAQFYNELIERFPKHDLVDDRVLYGAGIAAYETGKRFDWSEKHLANLVKHHPKSQFYRGAKLWLALAQYEQGEHKKFLATVEEFRLKYRNTDEWKILSRYYEDINYKVKK